MTHYDAIVIGGGLNGLTAAAYLARAGRKVLVLERRGVVGGAAATEEVFPGFKFDTVLHSIGWLNPQIARELKLERYGLEVLQGEAAVYAPLPGGEGLTLWRHTGRTMDSIARFSRADAEKWPAFIAQLAKLAGFIGTLHETALPSIASTDPADLPTALGLGRRLRGLGRADMIEAIRTLPMSVYELLNDWFEGDLLKGALGAAGVSGLTQGPRSMGTTHLLLHHHAGAPPGAIRYPGAIRGGTGGVARAVASAAENAGAEIRVGVEVTQIVRDGDQVTGVALRGGEEIPARVVLSGADPRSTLLRLLDPMLLDPSVLEGVRNIKFRGSAGKVNLALDRPPDFGVPPEHLTGVISISPTLDYIERAADRAKYGQFPQAPALEATIPTLLDPSRAPQGKHVMSVWVQFPPYHLREGNWDELREALGDLTLKTLEQYAPGLRSAVVGRQVLTPLDLEREYGLPEGNLTHGELMLDQLFFMRPLPGWGHGYASRAPLEGLYLCGVGTHPGTRMGAGRLAARAVLRNGCSVRAGQRTPPWR